MISRRKTWKNIVSNWVGHSGGRKRRTSRLKRHVSASTQVEAVERRLLLTEIAAFNFEAEGGYQLTDPNNSDAAVTEATDGGGDYFTRTDGSNIGASFVYNGKQGDFFFAVQDVNGEPPNTTHIDQTFDAIDISGFSSLTFSAMVAEDVASDNNQDWDANAALKFEYSIDGGAFQDLLAFESEGGTNTQPLQDTDFDGVGDGTALTDTFQTFTASIIGTGSSLILRARYENLDAGDEDVAIDNLVIEGETGGDSTPPDILSITRLDPVTENTNADVLTFRVRFNEALQNVDVADFAVNGTTTASVSAVAQASPGVYDVTVSGGDLADFDGTVGLDIAASQDITDGAGNAFVTAEPATDETYTLDNAPAPDVVLNELYVNVPGGDNNREYIEIRSLNGAATTLSNVTLLAIEGDGAGAGTVDFALNLGSVSTGSNGLLLLGDDYGTSGTPWPTGVVNANTEVADLNAPANLENGSNTYLLVEGFTGGVNTDYDNDNDGTFDTTPWTRIIDSVGWSDGGGSDLVYSDARVDVLSSGTHAVTRFLGDDATNSLSSWYGGGIDGADLAQAYDPAAATSNLPGGGRITPGAENTPDAVAPGVTIDVADGVAVNEEGPTSDTFTIVLDSEPTDDVTVTITVSDGETTTDLGSVTFTSAASGTAGSWEDPQVITVTAVDDSDDEGDHTGEVTFTVTSVDTSYNGLTVAPVSVDITDNDAAIADLSTAATDAVKDEGDSGTTQFTFTVTRSGNTTGATDVDWAVTSSEANTDDFDGTTLPAGTVSFDAGETEQTITVNVTGDADAEDDEAFTVTLSNATGGATITTAAADGTILDDDTVIVAPDVIINEIDADTDGTDQLEFIELFGPAGTSLDGLMVVLLNGSNDSVYNSIDLDGQTIPADGYFVIGAAGVANVDFTPADFDTNEIQNGADGVALYVGDPGDVTGPVTTNLIDAIVYGTNDSDDAELLAGLGESTQYNESANGQSDVDSLSRVPNGNNASDFSAQAPTPGTENIGAAAAGVTIDVADGVAVNEEGPTSDTFTIVLDSEPTADVTVTVNVTDGETTIDTASVTFTTGDWNIAQTITVTAVDDADDEGAHSGEVTFAVTGASEYDGLAVSPVAVDITDNDGGGVVATELYINEVMIDAPGADTGNEYIELRGTPNGVISSDTYIVIIEGDASNQGVLDHVFTLGGMQFGANGYLVLLQSGSTYTVDPASSVVTATGTGWGTDFSSRTNDLENGSSTFALVQADIDLNTLVTQDIDADDDGEVDDLGFPLTVIDSIGNIDGGATDTAYGLINVSGNGQGLVPAGSTLVDISAQGLLGGSYHPDYLARIGDSTGSAQADWVFPEIAGTAPNFSLATGATVPYQLGGAALDHIGASNVFDAPEALFVEITPTSLSENGGTTTARVYRTSEDISSPLVVDLSSDDATEATVPAQVTIGANEVFAEFLITAQDDAETDGDVTVTITASSAGYADGTDTVDIADDEVANAPDFQITEVFAGVSDGENGTEDWFEITNLGLAAGDIAGLYYEDDSNDPTAGAELPSVTLAPGESVIVLITDSAADVGTFESIWGIGANIITVDGPGLGGGGDTVNLYDGNTAGASLVESVTYNPAGYPDYLTYVFDAGGNQSQPTAGVDGAYNSAGYEKNDPADGELISLVGSPVDSAAPLTVTFSPVDDATGVPGSDNLVIEFNEVVLAGSGNVEVRLSSDNSLVEAVDVLSGQVTVDGTTVTIDPSADLAAGAGFHILIPATAFTDLSGNSYAGTVDSSTWNFTTAAGAEIQVEGQGTEIVSGDTTPDAADDTAFATVDTDGGTLTHTFTVRNVGDMDLDVSTVTVSAGDTADFSIGNFTAGAVTAGGSLTFDVVFDPASDGAKTATISIGNDDADENPYTFVVSGTGASPASIDVTEVFSGTDGENGTADWFEITNTGGAVIDTSTLWYEDSSNTPSEGVQLPAFSLNPGETVIVLITDSVADVDTWESIWGVGANIIIADGPGLGSGGDTVNLYDGNAAAANLIESVTYDPAVGGHQDYHTYIFDAAGVQSLPVAGTDGAYESAGFADGGSTSTIVGSPVDPAAPIVDSLSPADDTTGVPGGSNLVIDFNEVVLTGTGNIQIHLASDDSLVETIDVASGQITVDGTMVTIDPVSDLAGGTAYYVSIPSAAFTDLSGNAYSGISDAATWNFTTAAGAEIQVEGLSTEIVSGDTTPDAGDDTQFGTVDTAGGSLTHTFTIRNVGDSALDVSAITVSAGDTADFTIANFTAGSIAAGANLTFDVTFDPTSDGTKSATISIANDDADENPYTFTVEGTGYTRPSIEITEVFSGVDDGENGTEDWFEITNTGAEVIDTSTLYYEDSSDTPTEGVQLPAFNLNPGETVIVLLSEVPVDDIAAFEGIWGVGANIITVDGPGLGGGGDRVNLYDGNTPAANLIDSVTYDPATGGHQDYHTYVFDAAGIQSLPVAGTDGAYESASYEKNDPATGELISLTGSPVDPVAPVTVTFSPADDATDVAGGDNLIIEFNEVVLLGTGNLEIRLASDDSVVETIDVSAGLVTVDGSQATIDPTADLAAGTDFYVVIPSGTFTDLSGNDYAGTANATTWNFTTAGGTEIQVEGQAMEIVSGDTTPDAADDTQFGGAVTDGETVTHTFMIRNIGSVDLDVSSVTVSAGDTSDFSIANFTAGTVAGGASLTFDVVFDPTSDGIKTATVSIVNDDADENPYTFDVQGNGYTPATIAVTEFINDVTGEEDTDEWIELYNYGTTDVDLTGYVLTDEGSNTVTLGTAVIAAGDFLILAKDKAAFETQWLEGTADARVVDYDGSSMALGNGADELIISDPLGNVIYNMAWVNDETTGRATYLTDDSFTRRDWGTEAGGQINRAGDDLGILGLTGYEQNTVESPEAGSITSTTGDVGTPFSSSLFAAPELVVAPTAVSVDEGGSTTFNVSLSAQPSADVEVTIATSGDGDITAGTTTLTFTPTNWDTAQPVTVNAAEDADADNGVATVTVSSTGLTSVEVTATEVDNDTQNLVVDPTAVSVDEGGSATFNVSLSAQPSADVEVTIATSGDGDITAGTTTLTFTPTNWDTAQPVTVNAAEDADADNGLATVTVSSTGLTSVEVTATEVDNDTQNLVVDPTAVSVDEGGSATFNVSLSAQPSADVEVTIATSGDGDITAGTTTLTFTPSNWDTAQPVTVNAAEDADADNGVATVTVSSTGLTSVDVTATEVDNDSAAADATLEDVTFYNEDAVLEDGLSLDQTGQRSIIKRIEVVLDGEISVSGAAATDGTFTVTYLDSNSTVGLNVESATTASGKTVVVLSFVGGSNVDGNGSLIDGNYRLDIDGSFQGFDADGSGTNGGSHSIDFHRYYGDSDGDRDVDNSDYGNLYRAFYGDAAYMNAFDRNDDNSLFDETDAFFGNYGRLEEAE